MIKVETEYFMSHIVKKLKGVNEKLGEVDESLYDTGKAHYFDVRECFCEIDDLIKSIEHYEE